MKCCTEKELISFFFVGKHIPKLQIMWNNAKKGKTTLKKETKKENKRKEKKTGHACYSPLIERLTT